MKREFQRIISQGPVDVGFCGISADILFLAEVVFFSLFKFLDDVGRILGRGKLIFCMIVYLLYV